MNITLYEKYNKDKLIEVLECNNIPFGENDDCDWKIKFKKMLIKYSKKSYTKKGVKIDYVQTNKFGRYTAECGIQNFQKDVRKYIAGEKHVDIDIENCHPVILKQLLEKNEIVSGDFLNEYTTDRKKCMEKYGLTDKLEFIKVINNENTPKKECFKELHNRIYNNENNLVSKLLRIQSNKTLLKRISTERKKDNKNYNFNGSFISNFLQDIENSILQVIFKFIISKNIRVHTLMFDGLTLDKDDTEDILLPNMFNEIQERVYNELGYNIKLTIKSSETDWVPKKKEIDDDNDDDINYLGSLGDKKCYDLFREKYSKNIITDLECNIYMINNYGIWNKIEKTNRKLMDLIFDFNDYLNEQNAIYDLSTRQKRLNFIDGIITHLQDDNIIWNKNIFLLGFSNGVVDLTTGLFRKGKPEEFILNNTGYDFKVYDTKIAYDFMCQVQTNFKIREYFLYVSCLTLENINRKQEFYYLYGSSASNAKSFTCELYKSCLGKLAYRFPTNLITSSRENTENANPALSKFKDKLFCYCSEPDFNRKININVIKELTGDEISCRALYQGQDEYKCSCIIFMNVNVLPKLDNVDEGIQRRIFTIPFNSKFTDNPNINNINEFQRKDFTFDEKDELKYSMINLLIQYYKKLYDNNFKIDIPDDVKYIKNQYLNNNDEFLRFINDYIEKDENEFIQKKELLAMYNQLDIKKEYNIKCNKDEFINNIESKLQCKFNDREYINGKRMRGVLKGYKLKDLYNNDDNDY